MTYIFKAERSLNYIPTSQRSFVNHEDHNITWSELLPGRVDLDLCLRGDGQLLTDLLGCCLGHFKHLDQGLVLYQRALKDNVFQTMTFPTRNE